MSRGEVHWSENLAFKWWPQYFKRDNGVKVQQVVNDLVRKIRAHAPALKYWSELKEGEIRGVHDSGIGYIIRKHYGLDRSRDAYEMAERVCGPSSKPSMAEVSYVIMCAIWLTVNEGRQGGTGRDPRLLGR